MSDTAAILVVAIVVLLVAAAVVLLVRRTRGREGRAQKAEELRLRATEQGTEVDQARQTAVRLGAEAERAEGRAREARQTLAQLEARQEDTIREADRLDPP